MDKDTSENKAHLLTADKVQERKLNLFLERMFSPGKADFLIKHGKWWHRGDRNRWVLMFEKKIIGYCAVIPGQVLVKGQQVPALWWVDLIIDPIYRGKGLQTIFDRKVRERTALILGFPNELASKIHRVHGWGLREDFRTMLLPLQPSGVKSVQRSAGVRGLTLRSAAFLLTPWANRLRSRYRSYTPQSARCAENPDPETLAGIFIRERTNMPLTTYRDAGYIQWRFLGAPYRRELNFYLTGPSSQPTHYLVSRFVEHGNVPAVRILDLVGDLNDVGPMKDLLSLSIKDAVNRGAKQVTLLATMPQIHSLARNMGFYFSSTTRFCWTGADNDLNYALGQSACWVLADSDNDSPE